VVYASGWNVKASAGALAANSVTGASTAVADSPTHDMKRCLFMNEPSLAFLRFVDEQ
jgi:hypothetical protein